MALSACGGGSPLTLTQANLDKVQEGMTASEVKSILGNPTDSKTEPIPIVGGTKTTYVYSNKEDRVVIILKNDTVQSKEGHFVQAR
ncbi:MAG: outer membrane protein assembly factor BamE [Terrimicrobiaceae bacterium]